MAQEIVTDNILDPFITQVAEEDRIQADEVIEAQQAQFPEGFTRQEDDEDARSEADAAALQEEEAEDKALGINFAAANGDFDDDSELSDLDEEQFKDFDGTAPNQDEPAVYNLPSFRKKEGARKGEGKQKSRKRRNSMSDDDGKIYSDDERPVKSRGKADKVPPKPDDPEELRKWELDRTMDAALKGPAKRRRKDEDDTIAAMDDEIVALTEKMRLAAQADAEANAEKQIATAKLKLLPDVERILRSSNLYDSILDNNMLASVKYWLEPLPDKSLPALNIQRALFDALIRLPIKTEHLRESGVGKVVLFYKKSKKPEDFIKVQANQLISEWSRPIIRKSANHKTKRVVSADYDPAPTGVPRLLSTVDAQDTSRSQYRSKGGTVIPRGEKAYDIAPRFREVQPLSSHADGGEAYKAIKNRLKDLGKKGGPKKGGVSIEGRGIA